MYHHTARARRGQLLFTTWDEGLALWRRVVGATAGLVAVCVMPNHVHVLARVSCRPQLGAALSGFARSWNPTHGCAGMLFEPSPPPTRVPADKRRRVHRYVVLNPCRAGLTRNPLAWPLSTYLDDVGLADAPVRRRMDDVVDHHAYIRSDDRVDAPTLPVASEGPATAEAILRAVSLATRTPLWDVNQRMGRARTLSVRAARRLNGWSVRRTATELGISKSAVGRVALVADSGVDIIARLATSHACDGLDDRILRRCLARSRYRHLEPPPNRLRELG